MILVMIISVFNSIIVIRVVDLLEYRGLLGFDYWFVGNVWSLKWLWLVMSGMLRELFVEICLWFGIIWKDVGEYIVRFLFGMFKSIFVLLYDMEKEKD